MASTDADTTSKPTISVLGSLNVDLVTRVDPFPSAGETRQGSDFQIHPGGKGANQAVAAAMLGADVRMFGALGDDPLAERLRRSLEQAGVDSTNVATRSDTATGTASIWVDEQGENAIAIVAGANASVDEAYVDQHLNAIAASDWVLLQGEIPVATMAHLLRSLKGGAHVILDPAPVFALHELPTERLWALTPNEHELAEIAGADTSNEDAIREACERVRADLSIPRIVCKAGARGAYVSTEQGFHHVAGYQVDVVDTTAAGDAFNGALATALGSGPDLLDAVRFANAAAALAVTAEGAQPAMPRRAEVDELRSKT